MPVVRFHVCCTVHGFKETDIELCLCDIQQQIGLDFYLFFIGFLIAVRPPSDCPRLRFMLNAWLHVLVINFRIIIIAVFVLFAHLYIFRKMYICYMVINRFIYVVWLHLTWVVDDAKCVLVTAVCMSVFVCPLSHSDRLWFSHICAEKGR